MRHVAQGTFTIPLRPSASLMAVLFLGHIIACGLVFPLVLPWFVKGALLAAIATSGFIHLRQLSNFGTEQAQSICLKGSGGISLLFKNASSEIENEVPIALRPGCYLNAWLVILLYQYPNVSASSFWRSNSHVILIPRDSTTADAHRQLRLWLRWRSGLETFS